MDIKENLLKVKKEIPNGVRLLAVSKTKPIEDLKDAYEAGQREFAENKIQELREKIDLMPNDVIWHFIGSLQTNKVKYLDERISLVHSLDRVKLLDELDKNAKKKGYIQKALIEVNIGREETKGGVLLENLDELVSKIKEKENILVLGIMAVIPKCEKEEQNKYFKDLFTLFQELKTKESQNFKMEILSMGMSGDYKVAIENGSTMVRLGRTIFGERDYSQK